jgi:hypothetical protein
MLFSCRLYLHHPRSVVPAAQPSIPSTVRSKKNLRQSAKSASSAFHCSGRAALNPVTHPIQKESA